MEKYCLEYLSEEKLYFEINLKLSVAFCIGLDISDRGLINLI